MQVRRHGLLHLGMLGVITVSVILMTTGLSLVAQASSGRSKGTTAAKGLAEARAVVQEYLKSPTSLGITTPLKNRPPSRKTVVWINCEGAPACSQTGDGFAQAAAALGWTYKSIAFNQAEPSTLISAMQTALQFHPVGVFFGGVAYADWATEVPAYARAGVKIVEIGLTGEPNTATVNKVVIKPGVQSPRLSVDEGDVMGNWFIAASKGKGNALVVDVPAITPMPPNAAAFVRTVAAQCPYCKTSVVNYTEQQFFGGDIDSLVVSDLLRNPKITYVYAPYADFIEGIVADLSAAGLHTKMIGAAWDATNVSAVMNGTEQAFVGNAPTYNGWEAMDEILRAMQGLSIPTADTTEPLQLLTAKTASSLKSTAQYVPAFNYRALFRKLWRLG